MFFKSNSCNFLIFSQSFKYIIIAVVTERCLANREIKIFNKNVENEVPHDASLRYSYNNFLILNKAATYLISVYVDSVYTGIWTGQ